jgi:putative alpha-1,2-mannosidase
MSELYFNNPNGLAGNEDCGQMSAWYVLNAMGFYSFCPGDLYYSIGRPVFDKVEIALSNDRTFTIVARNNGPENIYIQSASLNGEALKSPYFSHHSLMNGGILEFEMGPVENKHLFN